MNAERDESNLRRDRPLRVKSGSGLERMCNLCLDVRAASRTKYTSISAFSDNEPDVRHLEISDTNINHHSDMKIYKTAARSTCAINTAACSAAANKAGLMCVIK